MMSDMNSKGAEDLAKQLWDLANLITAFTVAQSVVVIYFAIEKFSAAGAWKNLVWVAILFIISGAGLYSYAVWACYRSERQLRALADQSSLVLEVTQRIARYRVITIMLFNSCAALITGMAAHLAT
jgi:hypothetical protein